jgi:hypothetical protein
MPSAEQTIWLLTVFEIGRHWRKVSAFSVVTTVYELETGKNKLIMHTSATRECVHYGTWRMLWGSMGVSRLPNEEPEGILNLPKRISGFIYRKSKCCADANRQASFFKLVTPMVVRQ